ncbi:MAG: nucleoside deaminase [Bacteroidota bacterium]
MLAVQSDEYFMRQALLLAEQAFEEDEVPIGAVVVSNYRIIGKGYNQTERLLDPTAHAEMLALTAACNFLGSKYLKECTLYVTVEPCPMCAAALRWSQIGRMVFGAAEPKHGYRRHQPLLLHPKTLVKGGLLEENAAELMRSFFQRTR